MFTHDKNMLSYDQIGCFFKPQANTSPRRWARILNSIKKARNGVILSKSQEWGVISWFISPNNYSYKYHKP